MDNTGHQVDMPYYPLWQFVVFVDEDHHAIGKPED